MRRVVLMLLILMLPLRAWAAGSMGVQMMKLPSVAAFVATSDSAVTSLPDGWMSLITTCAEDVDKSAAAVATPVPHQQCHCSACQLCMPLSTSAPPVVAVASTPDSFATMLVPIRFVDAELRPLTKPPIA